MRNARIRWLPLMAILIVASLVLWSHINDPDPRPPVTSVDPTPTQQPAPDDSGALEGRVVWPSGQPATNVQLVFYPQGYSSDTGTPYDQIPTDEQGRYVLTDCPCNGLVGFLYVPASTADNPFNGGRDCWLLMGADGTATGLNVTTGTQLDWQALNMPCDSNNFDPTQVQPVVGELLQQATDPANSQDFGYAGTWQDAQRRSG
jgi:hypothetical protein